MDTDLVLRAQRGDRGAFEMLMDAVGGRIASVASGVLRDPDLAKDATQQALLSIWQNLPRLRDPARFDAWAYRLTVRACYEEGRRSRGWMPNLLSRATEQRSTTSDLNEVIDRDQLERAFRRLSLEQRAVVVLHHYLDLSRSDVAEALGVPIGTVHSRLRHAMQALRAALDADARPFTPEHTAPEIVR